MKERLGMTEMRKAANRVIFGEVSILRLNVNFCSTRDFTIVCFMLVVRFAASN